ncbi:MAG: Fe-S cluster assembly protein SufD [Puniceicoccales bacterium]|jgi:Fe-S cluster assembly protein SufD|nr:Fe-S cluster assembly protein SufD [Puniceicoccales bacterium]
MPTAILSQETIDSQITDTAVPALAKLKQAGWEQFQQTPMPKRTMERWRFANLQHVTLEGYSIPAAPSADLQKIILDKSNLLSEISARLVFADGYLIGTDSLPSELAAKGVILAPLSEAAQKHPKLLEKYLLKSGTELGGDKFLALHQAYLSSGYVLYVPKGVEIEKPVVIYNWAVSAGAAIFPHTLIVAEDNARVSVVDFYLSFDETSPALATSAADIHAGAGAGVFRKSVQNWNEASQSYQIDTTHAEQDSTITSVSVNLGAKRARFESAIQINGTAANVRLYGLTVADRDQEFDQRTLQVHNAPGATSDLLYKNALLDQARTIFSGMIRVAPDAQKTDAYQTNRNLLLSPEAEANSLPGLEIEANDVKCSHGATTGQLDTSELFYMLARGIPKETAYELLVFGFFEEIIEKVDNEELAETLRNFVQDKFRRRETKLSVS